ncbi:MAG: efflux RND transporter periplasmic adaptor subunit [Alphaproteobacteria bacterium]|nr:efflux RND transporter periplasmic adaptor subunit [Alphaproteobacteria bacterium]
MVVIKKRTILKNIAIFLMCGAAGWYLKGRLTPQAGMMGMMGGGTPYVFTDKATIENVAPKKDFIGHVEAIKSVDLRPQITGYVEKVLFKEGSYVQEGDILFVIEQQRYLANLSLAEADLAKAQANLIKVEKNHRRQVALNKQKFASEAALDASQNELSAARAAVKQAQANLDLAKINVGYTTIKAPISGYIGKALVTEGNFVTSSSQTLARIVQTNPIRVVYSVNDKDFVDVRENAGDGASDDLRESDIVLPNGKTLYLKPQSRFADNEVNTDTATIAVYDEYDNAKRLLTPGNYVQVLLSTGAPQDAVVVPQAAIAQDAQGNYVFVVGADDIAEQRRVVVGDLAGDKQIIKQGLKAGEQVIVQGITKVQSGQKVKASPVLAEGNK